MLCCWSWRQLLGSVKVAQQLLSRLCSLFYCWPMVWHFDRARAQPRCPPVQGNSKLQELLKVHSMGEPPFPVSRHSFPDYSSIAAPVALPVEKDRVRLQVGASLLLTSVVKLQVSCKTWGAQRAHVHVRLTSPAICAQIERFRLQVIFKICKMMQSSIILHARLHMGRVFTKAAPRTRSL